MENERGALMMTTPHAHMLAEALAYAAQGLHVLPLHAPVFDDAGVCVGCTCEGHKRSANYQDWLTGKGRGHKFDPAFTCRTPGKHPRLSDWEAEASTDPATIRGWFAKWPTLNLGIAPGKSDLLMLDADTYKRDYAGADLLTQADQRTATAISGSGGQHLYYKMPAGATYGNATGDLPTGIDIRGHGGMVVVYPSIGPSGRTYQWEDGYSLAECPPIPLPAALVAILDAAQAKSTPAHTVTFTTPTTEPPQLGQWHLSKKIIDLIFKPAPVGERSEADYSVCLSLVYAGATDDDILAVFEHCPIGAQGKFAESGRGYLARTIGQTRGFAAANPRPDVRATVAGLRMWIRTHSFAEFVPTALKTHRSDRATGEIAIVYMTDATDTRVADAVLDAMATGGRLEITIGKKRLGNLAGVSCNTALAALDRLSGWLFDVTPDPMGARVALVENCRLHQIDPYVFGTPHVNNRDQSDANDVSTGVNGFRIANDANEYSPRKGDDPFLAGTSRHVKRQMGDAATTLGITDREALAQFTFKSFGESGLRVLDAMLRVGADMTTQELAEETGKKQSAIRTACQRLARHGLLDATREGSTGPTVYSLADDVWAQLEAATPHLRSYKMSDQREDKRLERAQQWTQHEIAAAAATGDREQATQLERRFAKQAKTRLPHLESLHPDLSAKEIERLAYEVAAYKRNPDREAAIKAQRDAGRDEHRATVALVADLIADTLDAGTTQADVLATVAQYGFDEALVRAVLGDQRLIERAAMTVGAETLARNIAQYKANGTTQAAATHDLQIAGFIPGEIERAWAAA